LRRMEMIQCRSYSQATPSPTPSSVATIHTHPMDVTSDATLTIAENRAILASWISDARAVKDVPPLRRLDSGAVVPLDEIRQALVSLDELMLGARETDSHRSLHFERRRGAVAKWLRRISPANRSHDDDDDPPPAPAGLGKPFRPTFVATHGRAVWKPGLMVTGQRARVAVSG
jgi:hypothetical protein